MPLRVEDVIARVEKALDWTFMSKPPPFEQRLQDIEAEIARLRRWAVAPQVREFVQRFDAWIADEGPTDPLFEAMMDARQGLAGLFNETP